MSKKQVKMTNKELIQKFSYIANRKYISGIASHYVIYVQKTWLNLSTGRIEYYTCEVDTQGNIAAIE